MSEKDENVNTFVGDVEAARMMGVSRYTLRGWRQQQRGPHYHKVGRRVVYSLDDLRQYMAARRITPGGEANDRL